MNDTLIRVPRLPFDHTEQHKSMVEPRHNRLVYLRACPKRLALDENELALNTVDFLFSLVHANSSFGHRLFSVSGLLSCCTFPAQRISGGY